MDMLVLRLCVKKRDRSKHYSITNATGVDFIILCDKILQE